MCSVQWTDRLATGVPEIDAQHQEILRRINEAIEVCCEGADPERGREVLDDTGAYIIEHFCMEERMLKADRTSFYKEHRKRHDEFILRYQDMRDLFDAQGPCEEVRRVLQELGDRLARHFAEADRELAPRLPLPMAGTYASLN